jgi:SAM-dependent methyltransferase
MATHQNEIRHTQQVSREHYDFGGYVSKQRWASTWHQLDEIRRTAPRNVLEVGVGAGVLKAIAKTSGLEVDTLDVDPELKPDFIGTVVDIPIPDASYDVVCGFQVLEHLPYEMALKGLQEMARVSRRHVLISLPDARPVWRYVLHIPKIGIYDFFVPRPRVRAPEHEFDGEHYWEINKRGYALSRIMADFTKDLQLRTTYRVRENPYHRFFRFERRVPGSMSSPGVR